MEKIFMVFEDRKEAGEKLAKKLIKYKEQNPVILALPRGGVPVGYEVAKKLNAPLSVLVVRKIGATNNPEFGIGAVSEGNVLILDVETIKVLNISQKQVEKIIEKEKEELKRRVKIYRRGKPLPDLENRTVILVDDGLATGVTAKAALRLIKEMSPKQIVLAFPACALQTAEMFSREVDELVCLITPYEFLSVGMWYRSFYQVTDEEVVSLLRKAEKEYKKFYKSLTSL